VVTRLPHEVLPIYALVAIVGAVALGTLMDRFTDADYAYWDATIATLSVIAQFLLSRRRLENWLLWICVDVLAIGLFTVKGLYPTAALYAVFLGLATTGLVLWTRAYLGRRALS
jgi:nicotinamide mononucleotide transporter